MIHITAKNFVVIDKLTERMKSHNNMKNISSYEGRIVKTRRTKLCTLIRDLTTGKVFIPSFSLKHVNLLQRACSDLLLLSLGVSSYTSFRSRRAGIIHSFWRWGRILTMRLDHNCSSFITMYADADSELVSPIQTLLLHEKLCQSW